MAHILSRNGCLQIFLYAAVPTVPASCAFLILSISFFPAQSFCFLPHLIVMRAWAEAFFGDAVVSFYVFISGCLSTVIYAR